MHTRRKALSNTRSFVLPLLLPVAICPSKRINYYPGRESIQERDYSALLLRPQFGASDLQATLHLVHKLYICSESNLIHYACTLACFILWCYRLACPSLARSFCTACTLLRCFYRTKNKLAEEQLCFSSQSQVSCQATTRSRLQGVQQATTIADGGENPTLVFRHLGTMTIPRQEEQTICMVTQDVVDLQRRVRYCSLFCYLSSSA